MKILSVCAAVSLAGACAAGLISCGPKLPSVCIEKKGGTEVCVAVETMRTQSQRQLGLMYRRELAPDSGMLFVFETEGKHPFTMKNTYIPLDIIFISRDMRIVGWAENTRPLTPGPYGVDRPSMYVLEVNARFCREQEISVGDRVRLEKVE